ncbi:hypothetical protein JCM13304A_01980 [Desulfothermus okinawensis JCM 13304]
MTEQIKIDQTPPVEVKDKDLNIQEYKQRDTKRQKTDEIKIDLDNLSESQRILEKKLQSSQRDSEVTQISTDEDLLNKRDKKSLIQKLSEDDLKKIKDATNEVLAQIGIQLDFELDKNLGKVIVKVINKETGKVIRQIPPEEMLKIAKRMEEMSGVLIDKWS